MTYEEAKQKHTLASLELIAFNNETRRQIAEATQHIRAAREEEEARLVALAKEANRAVADAQHTELTANRHPLEGRKMVGKVATGMAWRPVFVDAFGIFETVTRDTQLPSNLRYSRPRPGSHIIRLLKKDGTPGAKFERYSDGAWKPVDEPGQSND